MNDAPFHVLVIDDEASVRESIRRFLEDGGYVVRQAEDGRVGLELFKQEPTDLVLVDLRMPEVDGLEVLSQIVGMSPDTPVMVVSGTGVLRDAIEALRLGAWDFLTKPIEDMGVLLYAVERALERARLLRENRAYQDLLEERVTARTKELQETAEALRTSEQQFRTVVEASKDGIVAIDDAGAVVIFNPAAEKMFGHSAHDMIGQPLDCLMPEPYVAAHGHYVDGYFTQGSSGGALNRTLELPGLRADGSVFPMELSLSAGDRGGESFVLAIIRDITERKQAEQALRESEGRYRVLFETSPEGILIAETDSQSITYANLSMCEMLGYGESELCRMKVEDLLPPNTSSDTAGILETFARGGRSAYLDVPCLRKDGSTTYVDISCAGCLIQTRPCIVGFFKDISKRREAEHAVNTRLRYEKALAACSHALLTRSHGARREMLEHLLAATEASRVFLFENFDGEDGELWMRQIDEVCAAGIAPEFVHLPEKARPYRDEFLRWRKELASDRPVVGNFASPLSGEADKPSMRSVLILPIRVRGKWSGFIGFDQLGKGRAWGEEDIRLVKTAAEMLGVHLERRQTEEELSRYRNHLEELVEERTLELRESEERFRVLAEAAFEGIMIHEDGVVARLNDRFSRMFGYEPEELLGRQCIPLTFAPESVELVLEHTRSRTSEPYEAMGQKKNGATFPVEIHARPMQLECRTVQVAAIRDISSRRRAEKALRESENRLRSILNNAPALILLKNMAGRYILVNRRFEELFGISAGQAVGMTDYDLFPRDLADMSRENDMRVLEEGMPREFEEIIERGDKQYTYLSIKFPMHDDEGRAYGVCVISSDISDRKRAEGELRQAKSIADDSAEQLNKYAQELEWKNFELEHARSLAETASAAKSEFLANMSHEIRTPLNGIVGMTEVLLGTPLSPEQSHYAETIRKSSDALLEIIRDILDFSKIEAGKLDLDTLDFDLRSTMEDIGDLLAVRAHQKGLELICSVDDDVTSLLRGDPGRLRQILLNLGGNAVKFTERGEVVIRVSVAEDRETEVLLRFDVTDTGIGIPPDRIQGLFESFTQLDASTTRRYGGTGLGLAISKRLVNMMGGTIGADSVPERGSSFWFTILLERQPEDSAPALEFTDAIRDKRVLIVDDNATQRLVLESHLHLAGCRYDCAAEPEESLTKLRAAAREHDPFDIALIDWRIAGVDGEWLGASIKEDDLTQGVPLVIMVSTATRGDANRFREAGFAAFLVKPIRRILLLDCISAVLAAGSYAQDAEPKPLVTQHNIAESKRRRTYVLVVEDSPTNRDVALTLLAKIGYRADAVCDGSEAIQALQSTRYGVVLMDVQMPGMDGYEATRRIRDPQSSVANHDIPIVAMTAHALEGDRQRCLDAGMTDYVSKPVRTEELARALARVLSESGAPEPAPASALATTELSKDEVFRKAELLQRVDGDEDIARRIVDRFLEEAPSRIDCLRLALNDHDIQQLEREAHALKGAAATVAACALSEVALRLEKQGKAGEWEGADVLVETIVAEFDKTRKLMRQSGMASDSV